MTSVLAGLTGGRNQYNAVAFSRAGGLTAPDFGPAFPSSAARADVALPLASCFLISMTVLFAFGLAMCLSAKISLGLTGALADSAFPLPPCFLTSVLFGFGVGVALRGRAWPVVAKSVLALVSSFLTSLPSVFGFGTGNGVWRPAAIMSSSRGTSIAKRPRLRIRPATRPPSSPAPPERATPAGPHTA